jgi:hypothetical protein
MDPTRFDTITRLFASRRTRRAAVGSGLGLAATALGGRALAQDATPVATPAVDPNDPHPSADTAANVEFLYVQPFSSGAWAPKDGEDGTYTLTLSGAAGQTVSFSDRPERIVGLIPTQQLLDTLGFSPTNPPNAALVATQDGGDEQDILVIELLNPAYDADAGTLTYDARVIVDYGDPGLAHLARQQTDYELAERFGEGSLFIDDGCSAQTIQCHEQNTGNVIGTYVQDWCHTQEGITCGPCDDPAQQCMERFGNCCGGFNDQDQCVGGPTCTWT